MSLDRNKVLQVAQKHLGRGNYDKAITEYRKLVEHDPRDVRTWLKIGDIYTKKGSRTEAIQTYSRVADHYASQGFFLKAVAVYKQMLKLDQSRLDLSLKLAEMYENLQLTTDALNTYEQVAAFFMRSGDIPKALETLGKMAELDPDNIPVRIKFAEALSKAERTDEAAEQFEAGAELLKEQGRMDDYLKVAERLLYHRPADTPLARELAKAYLEKNDAKRALSKLQVCFKSNPRDLNTLELLAEAFFLLGQSAKTVSVYREMTRIYEEGKRPADRIRILEKILEIDPNDVEAKKALDEARGQGPTSRSVSAAIPDDMLVPPGAVVQSQVGPTPDSVSEMLTHPPPHAAAPSAEEMVTNPPPRPAAAPVEEDDDDDVMIVEEELDDDEIMELEADEDLEDLDEDVMIVEEIEVVVDDDDDDVMIIEEEPEEVGAPDEGTSPGEDIPAAAGAATPSGEDRPSVPPEVAREMQVARLITECEVFERYGLQDKVIAQLERVLEIAPEHIEAREKLQAAYRADGRVDDAVQMLLDLAQLTRASDPDAAKRYWTEALQLDDENIDARMGLKSLQPTAMEAAFETETKQHKVPAAANEPEPARPVFVETDTAEESVFDLDDSEDIVEMAPAEPVAAEPVAAEPAPEGEHPGLREMSPAEFEAAPLTEVDEATRRAEVEARLAEPTEIEETLDEVDFYLAQGMFDEARDTLEDALAERPTHAVLQDKMQQVAEAEEEAEHAEPPAVDDDAFALAEKLAEEIEEVGEVDEVGQDVLDVETVFAQFKKGVEEQVDAGDSETHFDLGIAYKEMGLLPDAIGEFELAMSNPEKVVICRTMMGMCHTQNGDPEAAIEQFKLGLAHPGMNMREELGLHFELGMAYESKQEYTTALVHYMEVKEGDPTFRGIDERIEAVQNPDAAKPADPFGEDEDDIDAAFDDLMGD